MSALGVHSEIGRLRKVLVHRPGLNLERLTPNNCRQFSFDNVPRVQQASREHDAFVRIMRERGVEVFLAEDLLAETLRYGDAKEWLLDRRLHKRKLGSELAGELRDWLEDMAENDLAKLLIGGIAKAELPFKSQSLTVQALQKHEFVLPPLPNQLFTRDSSCWIGGGVALNALSKAERREETCNISAIYHFHPIFEQKYFDFWWPCSDENPFAVSFEGGDVMPIAERKLVIGMGVYTTPQAIAALAARLFARDAVDTILVAQMPPGSRPGHLDEFFALCDHDLAIVSAPVVERIVCYSIQPGKTRGKLRTARLEPRFPDVIAQVLGLERLRVVEIAGTDQGGLPADVCSHFALEPGVVIGFDRDAPANMKLREAGVEVITTEACELSRAGGGPHRLACPLLRDPLAR